MDLKNEEDAKIKRVIPVLRDLGIKIEGMSFETYFKIRLGRTVFEVGSDDNRTKAAGYSDILIKSGDQNLFIVEVKHPDKDLTGEDRDQAISYARLLDSPAPYAITTNGNQWKVFDVITKEEITNVSTDTGYQFSLDSSAKKEAREYFLTYSKENLIKYCKKQNEIYLERLKGDASDRDKKFIPDLYVPPPKLEENFNDFLRSSSQVFVLVARSGMGKTCWAVHTAEKLTNENIPTLFFSGTDVRRGIVQRIADDLDWVFSDTATPVNKFTRLVRILSQQGLRIIVDDLTRLSSDTVDNVTGEFIRNLKNLKGKFDVRLICTSTAAGWRRVESRHGNLTELGHAVEQSEESSLSQIYGISDEHFLRMVESYREFYGFYGNISRRALKYFRSSPFFMRLAFEVAEEEGITSLSVTLEDVFENYIENIVQRVDQTYDAKVCLKILATEMIESGKSELFMSKVYDLLGQKVHDVGGLISEFEELQVLSVTETKSGENVAYYFPQLRNYWVISRVLDWPNLDKKDFRSELNDLRDSQILEETIALYCHLADEEHLKVIGGDAYSSGDELVSAYEGLLDKFFPGLKKCFPPHAEEIGSIVIGNHQRNKRLTFGFRNVEESKRKVIVLLDHGRGKRDRVWDETAVYGVKRLFTVHEGNVVPAEWANSHIEKELEKILEDRSLFTEEHENLMLEKVIGASKELLPELYKRLNPRTGEGPESVSIEHLKNELYYKRAYTVIKEQKIMQKIKNKRKKGHTGPVNVSIRNPRGDWETQATELANEKGFVETEFQTNEIQQQEVLYGILEDLEARSVEEVRHPYLGKPDSQTVPGEWDSDTLAAALSKVWKDALDSYERIVEKHFARLKSVSELGKRVPQRRYIRVLENLSLTRMPGFSCQMAVHWNGEVRDNDVKVVEEMKWEKACEDEKPGLYIDGGLRAVDSYSVGRVGLDKDVLLHEVVYGELLPFLLDAWNGRRKE